MGLVLIGYRATLVLPGDRFSAVVDVWLPILAQWVPAAICWMVVSRSRSRPWEIVFSAAALSAVATGSMYFYLTLGLTGSVLALPSPADLGYLSFTPLMLIAVVVSGVTGEVLERRLTPVHGDVAEWIGFRDGTDRRPSSRPVWAPTGTPAQV